ncbi:hypothetical protein ACF3M2_09835 [Tissierella carlieri]|uniref:hypothetical protein n=1 Tax=Tissierella carlieri TaxID=689904 RepID=UPI00386CBD70
MNISENKTEFINIMEDFKKEIEDTLNRSIYSSDIDELRPGYEGKFSKERFKEYLVKKNALHIVFKYIFIRMMSEGERLVNPKLNEEGITNWKEMTKNYRGDYLMLFKIASEDLRRIEKTRDFFEPTLYDKYLDKLEYSIFNKNNDNFIDKLKDYDFRTLDPNTAVSLFDCLYPSEDREKLQGFLDESYITTYLVTSLGLM